MQALAGRQPNDMANTDVLTPTNTDPVPSNIASPFRMELNHCPRVLSLDGGGVRGLSSLLILREIMEEIGRRTESAETPRPSQYFDLIGGTGTGGIIAIMLGRLGMVCPLK